MKELPEAIGTLEDCMLSSLELSSTLEQGSRNDQGGL